MAAAWKGGRAEIELTTQKFVELSPTAVKLHQVIWLLRNEYSIFKEAGKRGPLISKGDILSKCQVSKKDLEQFLTEKWQDLMLFSEGDSYGYVDD
jgi:hypothetical protein